MAELGLVSISFRNLSVDEILAAVKQAGLSCVEWGSDVHAPCMDTEKLEYIAKRQQQENIRCCSYGTYFRLGVHRTEELLPYIKAAKILGTDILRLWCGDKGSAEYTPEELEKLHEDCRAAAKLAKAHQVKLCLECHNNTLTDWKEPASDLMKAVDSPAFGMFWQPNQWRTVEENLAYIGLLAEYTEHIHVFHWKENERYPLEEGVELWKRYLAGFSGKRTLLLEFMPDDNVESLTREAQALRKIAGEC